MQMLQKRLDTLADLQSVACLGKVRNITGLMIRASGISARIGDVCLIRGQKPGADIMAEVVGIREDTALLMAYGDVKGVGLGSLVEPLGHRLRVPVGDFLIGRTVDSLGAPIDGQGDFPEATAYYSVDAPCVNPMHRPRITESLQFGVKAIDGMLAVGKGQRIGIFAGSGVGKSTLLGMIARNVKADVNVIALVGERGRELKEFIEKDLGPQGMARSVLMVATSDQPAMYRAKCAYSATAVAEYFRDQGLDVLLMMDSLTRFAMAQREIGLSAGEPPVARGYTPSLYAELPRLLERSGNFESGSITGVYTVLVEGDDTNEPIADTVRGILDGHVVLDRELAHRGHYPAINIGGSISRLMNDICGEKHLKAASKIREWQSLYEQNRDLIAIGAYKKGTNHRLDEAMQKIDAIRSFLMQAISEAVTREETIRRMEALAEE